MRAGFLGTTCVLVACAGAAKPPNTPPAAVPSASAAKPVPSAKASEAQVYTLPMPLPPTAAKTDPIQTEPALLKDAFTKAKPGTPEHVRTGRALAETCRSAEVRRGDETLALWGKLAATTSDAKPKAKFLEKRKAYEAARQCVIGTYRAVATMDRKDAKGDEVLLHLAAEYAARRVFDPAEDEPLQRADADKSRTTLLELVSNWPYSKHVPTAYRIFADDYYDKAAADVVDWTIPRDAYGRVHDVDPKSIEAAYASYRLGHVHVHLGDAKLAKECFERAVTEATALGGEPHASEVLAAAEAARARLP